jgi:hypothetical protein
MCGALHVALYLCETGFWERKTKYTSRLNASPVLRIQLPIVKPNTKVISERDKKITLPIGNCKYEAYYF